LAGPLVVELGGREVVPRRPQAELELQLDQRGLELGRVGEAIVGLLGHAAQDQGVEARRQRAAWELLGERGGRPNWLVEDVIVTQGLDLVADEGEPPAAELEERDAKGVD